MRRQDRERLVEDPRQHVANAQATARDADDLVEPEPRFVHGQREPLNQQVVGQST